MKSLVIGLTAATVIAGTSPAALAESSEAVAGLDHVFVLVLENHNAFTSFGSNGILDNPQVPHIQALAKKIQLRCQLQCRVAPEPAELCGDDHR
jgi:hypothetical protein